MKTAVEWYAEQSMRLELEKAKGNISINQMLNRLSNVLDQAKEMEKEQIVEGFNFGVYDGGAFIKKYKMSGEQYYNEAYLNS
jgi:hypothetical protein